MEQLESLRAAVRHLPPHKHAHSYHGTQETAIARTPGTSEYKQWRSVNRAKNVLHYFIQHKDHADGVDRHERKEEGKTSAYF